MFANFTILCFQLLLLLYYQSQSLNTQHSKHALEVVSGRFCGSNEPPKVVISLNTSFKNQVFKRGASKTSPKPLLRSFWTARALQNEAQERSQTHSRTLILVLLVLLEAHSSLHDTPKGLENGCCSDFNRYSIVVTSIYVSLGNILLLNSNWGNLGGAIHSRPYFTFDHVSFTYNHVFTCNKWRPSSTKTTQNTPAWNASKSEYLLMSWPHATIRQFT